MIYGRAAVNDDVDAREERLPSLERDKMRRR